MLTKPIKYTCFLSLFVFTSCGEEEADKYGQGIFNFDTTEIVSESTPSQLQSSSTGLVQDTPDEITQIRDRLYLSQASNSIPNMIQTFQDRIDELDTRTAGYEVDALPLCVTATPTETTVVTPDGQNFAMEVQCYEELSDTSFMIWGKDDDGVSYIYERSSVSASIVKVTPNDDGTNSFDGYLSFLAQSADEAGTVVHLVANQSAKTVQANLVAPHEVCGVNMFANEEKIHFRGSISTGTANACPAESDYVYSATDLTESTGFDASLLLGDTYFMKRTAGNKLVNGSTQAYEEYANTSGSGNVSLSYATDPTSSTTDANFGPSSASELGGAAYVSQ
ncbi:hypothetical protein [Pseudobacteriovorax antillogorgiicola]|uniref:Lipoprotein n=1 Tax=Pseudobacteriovorax antillogorgiicola TaxID=1513793 RepID=A0A1Y6BCB1_9BACT|nr:hypothetical protein [Pseudobacteriovorax antillogorgiicola]TCS57351.1 hypothetical protein EDD56_10391 [Pseudobacteriovorax antillogorgiicola]SMF02113.1 hypothetical protein SAMN06296036_103242 [Pseudobacteriovorax antillogorgiicola]